MATRTLPTVKTARNRLPLHEEVARGAPADVAVLPEALVVWVSVDSNAGAKTYPPRSAPPPQLTTALFSPIPPCNACRPALPQLSAPV